VNKFQATGFTLYR